MTPARTKAKAVSKPPRKAQPGRRAAPKDGRALPEGIAYVDGRVLDLRKATVPLNDRGYLLGDGVFETLRTSNRHVFRLADHAARVERGLKAIGLEGELESEFEDAVHALAQAGWKTYGGELYLRINVSTGPMGDVAGSGRGITVTGICKKFKPYPLQYYANGVQVIVSKQRKDSRSPLASIKTLSFLPYVAARREALSATAHDALLLNEHDRVAEATTSNVFALRDGVVHAPGESEGAVAGVTRGVVLGLLADADLELAEELDLRSLREADEVFLTNTTGGIVPVTRFGDRRIGTGKKGELTTRLSHALEELIRTPDGHA